MKKRTKTWLIVAGVLCITGALVSGGVIAANGFDFTKFDTNKDHPSIETTIDSQIVNIKVDVSDYNVSVVPGYSESVEIIAPDDCTVDQQGNEVVITQQTAESGIAEYFTVNFSGESSNVVKIKLPYNQYEYLGGIDAVYSEVYLNLTASSGDISVSEISCYGIQITTTSGDIKLENAYSEDLALTSSSGDVNMNKVCNKQTTAQIKSSSGDINASDATFDAAQFNSKSGDITLSQISGDAGTRTTSGDVELTGISVGDVSAYTDSGEINIKDSFCALCETYSAAGDTTISYSSFDTDLNMVCDNGDANLKTVKAQNFYVQTVNGDIDALVVAEKDNIYINAKSQNGDVDEPETSIDSKILFKAESENGDIKVEIYDNGMFV